MQKPLYKAEACGPTGHLRTIVHTAPFFQDRSTEMNTQPRSLAATLLPIGLLLIAMASIQSGASLAKSMFPIIGAQGTTTDCD